MRIKKKLAKPYSYGNKRKKSSVEYIVIHYTGNKCDTAKGNANYFATSNTRNAGAHFFVDKNGEIYKSVNMNRIAWSVGGDQRSGEKGEARFFGVCTNVNSVSIELCDCIENVNDKQMEAVKYLIKYIRKYCKNVKKIVRHWDVNGKKCPAPFVGVNNSKWKAFLLQLDSVL